MSLFGDPEEYSDHYWNYKYPRQILGCEIVQTCAACPEQYEVFLGDQQIGYLRLRHGTFRADYPDCGGLTVYEIAALGDGVFEPLEREPHMLLAVRALLKRHKSVDSE